MLPRANRLTRKEIPYLKKGARRIFSSHLSLSYTTNTESTVPKISCSVSKKVERSAVKRNKIKRQCREAVRHHITSVKKPILGLLSVKKSEHPLSFNSLSKEMGELFSKVE